MDSKPTEVLPTTERVSIFSNRVFRWILIGVLGVAAIATAVFLILRNLSTPPPVYQDVYSINLGGLASVELDTASDHLLALPDESVQVYIPQGSYPPGGSMVILPHASNFIPQALEDQTLRIKAADIFIVSPSGDVQSRVQLDRSILICFTLDSEQRMLDGEDGYHFAVERYDELQDPPAWVELMRSPGWEEGQVCAATNHLSLYAMAVTFPLEEEMPTMTPAPTAIEPPAEEEPYGIPTVEP